MIWFAQRRKGAKSLAIAAGLEQFRRCCADLRWRAVRLRRRTSAFAPLRLCANAFTLRVSAPPR